MRHLILDASFVAGLLLAEEYGALASNTLRQSPEAARIATNLLPWEIANILRTKRRRRVLSAGQSRRIFIAFLDLEIELAASPDLTSAFAVAELADQYALSAYDAGYLELAMRYDGALATNDRNLAKAAEGAGLTVLSPFT